MIVRPVQHNDLNDLFDIAQESGPGFTSLVPDRDRLVSKIEASIQSFRARESGGGEQRYLFVLEDESSGQIMGTTGIGAGVGQSQPLYHFRHSTVLHHSRELGIRRPIGTLSRCVHYRNCTELCSLYLRPSFRRAQAGKLLSRVRFAFIAQHPGRFPGRAIAQMRGVADVHGQSPFWNWLRERFVDLDFRQVTRLASEGAFTFVEELMPSLPIYTHLMDPEARSVIGHVHPDTRPALAMLKSEGFRPRGLVDLLDAGPTVECQTDHLRSVREATLTPATIACPRSRKRPESGHPVIVTNTGLDGFRAIVVLADPDRLPSQPLSLTRPQAKALNINEGEPVRTLALDQSLSAALPTTRSNSQERHHAL
ncbi:arginine N-succinyltransferase [Marinobacter daepoensis]|uniref:arginine N-succinyltransferase n=1 Tax=Marinobacter daepoensis TaxID=262077 RepID=UPI001C97F317|nr:arginine N-succinyltransferase [Marinobacter daepoensis]MBY6033381.1 arginine N-succinyltransferase [Marinobacter daepoensis]